MLPELNQAKLHLKIDAFNSLESWGSGNMALIPERKVQKIIEKSFNSLVLCPNESLNFSLLTLIKRVNSEECIGFKLKDLANKIQNSLLEEIPGFSISKDLAIREPTPVFPVVQDSTTHILKEMKIKDLSNLSMVSHCGNKIGYEAIIARIKEVANEGENDEGPVKYLENLESSLNSLSRLMVVREGLPVLNEILNKRLRYEHEAFEGYEDKEERLVDVLERIKNIPNEELIELCASSTFYLNKNYTAFRKFLALHFDIKSPLEASHDKKMQGNALCQAVIQGDINIIHLLLRLGVEPSSIYDNPENSPFHNKTALECGEIVRDHRKKISRFTFRDNTYEGFFKQLITALNP